MEIGLLSGAYKNAGDFLIEKRAQEILQNFIPGINIHHFLRNEISDNIKHLNKMDALVFTGGPIYMEKLETHLKLKQSFSPPIMVLGGGWHGLYPANNFIVNYRFSNFSKSFWDEVEKQGFGLSCRDIYTYQILKNNGYNNILMTGWPAWYNISFVEREKIINENWSLKNIFISNPAKLKNYSLLYELIKYLRYNFLNSNITLVFHRDKDAIKGSNKYLLNKILEQNDVNTIDISGSADGFKVYDNADLHIGFRVHAHIYNLSIRRRTVLIEEDGRGAGCDDTLGLIGIKAYNQEIQIGGKYFNRALYRINKDKNFNFITDVDTYLNLLEKTNDQYLNNAFLLMKKYYESMGAYIKRLEKISAK